MYLLGCFIIGHHFECFTSLFLDCHHSGSVARYFQAKLIHEI
jgi:hypothetical protein